MPRTRAPAPSNSSLPRSVAELEAARIVKRTVTLLDEVEQAMLAIYDEPEYKRFRDALDNDSTVEGSIFADDQEAARLIRKKAAELGLHQAAEANLTILAQKLRRAESRFNASRKQRAQAAA